MGLFERTLFGATVCQPNQQDCNDRDTDGYGKPTGIQVLADVSQNEVVDLL